jgi:hypothetical protein
LDGRIELSQLLGRVFDECGEDLAHELLVFQSDVPELIAVKDQSGVGRVHVYLFGRKSECMRA